MFFLELSIIFRECRLIESGFKVDNEDAKDEKNLRHMIINENLASELLCAQVVVIFEIPLRGLSNQQLHEHARYNEGHKIHYQFVFMHKL